MSRIWNSDTNNKPNNDMERDGRIQVSLLPEKLIAHAKHAATTEFKRSTDWSLYLKLTHQELIELNRAIVDSGYVHVGTHKDGPLMKEFADKDTYDFVNSLRKG